MNHGPKTIEELKQWYIDRNLPSESVTRFFIGKDYNGSKAFGIYKDEIKGNYVVYKNKADGTRNIRYDGPNEAYAVNELYQKLKHEIHNQKNNNPQNFTENRTNYKRKSIRLVSLIGILVLILIIAYMAILMFSASPERGYYNYNNEYYYYQNGSWYKYNRYNKKDRDKSWIRTTAPEILQHDYSDYYSSYDYMSSYEIDNFEYSAYYNPSTTTSSFFSSSSSSWSDDSYYDSGSDWDYDWDSSSSWDSSYTDWDSDW